MDTITKSMNMRSTIGRSPTAAAPIPKPMIACSAMGVSTTRSSPNSAFNPANDWKTPPYRPTSSPAINISGSSRSSSARVSLKASLYRMMRCSVSVAVIFMMPPCTRLLACQLPDLEAGYFLRIRLLHLFLLESQREFLSLLLRS